MNAGGAAIKMTVPLQRTYLNDASIAAADAATFKTAFTPPFDNSIIFC